MLLHIVFAINAIAGWETGRWLGNKFIRKNKNLKYRWSCPVDGCTFFIKSNMSDVVDELSEEHVVTKH